MNVNESVAADDPRPSGPRAITRLLDLMTLLADARAGMTLAELSMALGVPKSTFLATLRGLCERRYLLHEQGRYRLGPCAYHFASRIVRHWSPSEIIRAQVETLAHETRESVGFAIPDWELGQAIYTEAVNSIQPVRYAMQAGVRAPLYASAAGRVLLAHAPDAQVDAYLAHANLRRLTNGTRVGLEAIRANLDEVRRQGYCASFGEMLSDTAALAVPVSGPDGNTLGALMLAAPLERMRKQYDRFLTLVTRAGRHASGA